MKPAKTIDHCFSSLKDPIQEHEKFQLVYCAVCEFVYVGQTKSDLNTRIAEHKRAVKNQEPETSALCEHLMLCDYRVSWNGVVVLKYEENYYGRLTAERGFIHAHPYVINPSDGDSLPAVCRPFVGNNQN